MSNNTLLVLCLAIHTWLNVTQMSHFSCLKTKEKDKKFGLYLKFLTIGIGLHNQFIVR